MTQTINGFFLLPATAQFSRIFVGILAIAQAKYPVRIHAAVALTNHYHLIITPDDAEQLSGFMEFVNGNLAREVSRLVDWRGRIWADRYHAVPISPEPDALIDRLRYVLSHTVKENLVARISDWQGLHCAEALIDGKPMTGIWYDRTAEHEARRQANRRAARRGTEVEEINRGAFMKPNQVKLAPLPCWRDTPKAQVRKRVAAMLAEIEAEAARLREARGFKPLGMDRVGRQDPLSRPVRRERRPKPLCHAASKNMRERMRQTYRGFVEKYRAAAERIKLGKVDEAEFPHGSFPPALPFVRIGEVFDPLADIRDSPSLDTWAAALT